MSTAIQINSAVAPKPARAFYVRVAALGFILIALSGVAALITNLASGDTGENFIFALVFLVVGLLVCAAVWTTKRWALILAALLSLALLALVGPFSLFVLAHPESATDFIPVVLMLAGAALGLFGAIAALVQSRGGVMREHATGAERLALSVLLGVVALAALFSAILTLANRTFVPVEARPGTAAMQIKSFAFSPQTWQAKAGEQIRIIAKNDDTTLHTFTFPAGGVDVAIPPGSERLIEFRAPAADIYQWYCIPHSSDNGGTHTGMVGALIVK